jgi:predicted RNA-binding protein with PUA-like domain
MAASTEFGGHVRLLKGYKTCCDQWFPNLIPDREIQICYSIALARQWQEYAEAKNWRPRVEEATPDKESHMAYWLLKTEPDCYAWADLQRDKKTLWDGVTNALALKNIRSMKKGDLALIYHTGNERAAVGIAEIVSPPYPDPKEQDDKIVVVDLKAKKKLPEPVGLDVIKADKVFTGWILLRIGRLSVVPVPESMWKRIMELAGAK